MEMNETNLEAEQLRRRLIEVPANNSRSGYGDVCQEQETLEFSVALAVRAAPGQGSGGAAVSEKITQQPSQRESTDGFWENKEGYRRWRQGRRRRRDDGGDDDE
ncbi:hypothetical protein PIB30_072264 [Stylosanthes scabra]|uniref:Uncharacterized protein n=1 Tax=Stylosanthes scabra TaxID=79078 RepID=A0ABU6RPN6_9FABA|nr:hypothetical protein [Stylosanthes scabra]